MIAERRAAEFRLPGATDRAIFMGATGTGKTTLAAHVLSRQNMHARPWVILDFKNEELWDKVRPERLRFGKLPGKRGLYIMSVLPGQEHQLEGWLWQVWRRENIGIFCDEATYLAGMDSCKAILRQGRSKRIPVIACTQRPIGIDREFFTESGFKSIMRLDDERDYKVVKGFTRGANVEPILPDYWSYWHDNSQNHTFVLRPAPKPNIIAGDLRAAMGVKPVTLKLG